MARESSRRGSRQGEGVVKARESSRRGSRQGGGAKKRKRGGVEWTSERTTVRGGGHGLRIVRVQHERGGSRRGGLFGGAIYSHDTYSIDLSIDRGRGGKYVFHVSYWWR